MAALLSVHHLPIVFSLHGERPSMTGLAYHNIYITLPNTMWFKSPLKTFLKYNCKVIKNVGPIDYVPHLNMSLKVFWKRFKSNLKILQSKCCDLTTVSSKYVYDINKTAYWCVLLEMWVFYIQSKKQLPSTCVFILSYVNNKCSYNRPCTLKLA